MAGNGEVPSLIGVASRVNLADFTIIVRSGKGQMPAHPGLDAAAINTLYTFLSNGGGRGGGGFGGRVELMVRRSRVPWWPMAALLTGSTRR